MNPIADLLGINDATWMAHPDRNCATGNPDNWFPPRAKVRQARRLCNGCPVTNQCLTYALNNPELEGIWGGTGTDERDKIAARIARRVSGS